jgi:hypothetical protein
MDDTIYKTMDGTKIMENSRMWEFPKNINIEKVSEYIEGLKNIKPGENVTLDLRKTISIHSSFIGFLIHTKHYMQKNGGSLCILLSLTVEKILIMLNIIDYFSPEITSSVSRKSA